MGTRPFRIGAFGVGRMGQVHVEHLVRLHAEGAIEFVAIGDRHAPTLEAAAALLDMLGFPPIAPAMRFDDAGRMAAAGLDAVVIASRTDDHVRDMLPFVERGTAVLVEKPLAGSIDEAASLLRSLGEDGARFVQVAFQRRYDEASMYAMAWVEEGRVGKLQQSHHVLQDKNPTPAGYQSSGITSDMAIHLVYEAMSLHASELPQSVRALRFLAPHYVDEAAEGANIIHAFCTWRDGSVAHLWGSRINNTGYDNGFKVIGTEGRIDVGEFVGDFGQVSVRLWRGTGPGPSGRGVLTESFELPMTPPSDRHPDFYPRYAQAYAGELASFVSAVKDRRRLEPGPDIGWKTLFVANLAEASSRADGRRFDLESAEGAPIRTVDDAAEFARSHGVT
jgi:myo-inositol 2-dehydrogenase/D-chiro-inositol 1-dehydrogenase